MEKITQEDIDIYRLKSEKEGPHLMISGAVHGNEKSGPRALTELLARFESGAITLSCGTLTIIPITNPRAYQEDVRFIDRNLNRSMYPRDEVEHYEDRLRNVLCPILAQTDYLLDLHSCTAKSDAFVIAGGDLTHADNVNFIKGLGVPRTVWGWSDIVGESEDLPDPRHAFGMTEYAREYGAHAITIECGNHEHEHGKDMAYQAACNAIKTLGLAGISADLQKSHVFQEEKITIRLKKAQFKIQEGAFFDAWENMQVVSKGTDIGRFDDGTVFTMPEDGYLVMPNKNAVLGAEWFYWGVREEI